MLLHRSNPAQEQTEGEDGYLLLTVLVLVFLMLLALSVAAPRVAKEIQRDKELETVRRGMQYRRAIQLYYKKFGSYPTDIKQLENTNQIRYLRKRYTDPMTGKDDWRLIHVGEAKVPPMGFFGQPLQTGLSSVSTGPGVGNPGSIYAPTNNTDGAGSTDGSSSGSSNGSGNGAPNAPAGSSNNSGSSSFGFNNSGSNSNSGFGSSNSGFGSSGGGFGSSNNGFGSNTNPTGTNGPGASTNSGGATFGGGPIVGVGLPVKKDSLIEYHKQKKYSQWEFVYDPQSDQMMNAGGVASNGIGSSSNGANAGQNGGNNPQSGGSPFGFNNSGNSSGSSGSGNSGSSGNSGFGNFGSGSGSNNGGSGTSTPNNPQQ